VARQRKPPIKMPVLDPSDLSRCYAFTADRARFIGKLDANKRISPMATVDELREANAAVGRRRNIMHQASRESAARTRDAVDEMNARRRQRVAASRATGTDDTAAKPTMLPASRRSSRFGRGLKSRRRL